jgi:hypothetical protein
MKAVRPVIKTSKRQINIFIAHLLQPVIGAILAFNPIEEMIC